ncbi:MAG: esterase/lipase family protein [Isosphaeraceae bacterium]
MPRAMMNDLLVILPGITGSVLQRNGKDIWNASWRTLWSAALSLGGSIQSLQLGADDLDADVAPDGVRATALIEIPHLVAGLAKVDGYTNLFETLTESFELYECGPDDETAGNFLKFPYDWRRDIRASARRLARVLHHKLDLWRQDGGTADSRAIIIAHSMGGLVAQYALDALDGWPDCRALISFGTPYRGSVKSVEFVANGLKALGVDMSRTLRSFPSVYQLLPRYAMVATGSGERRVSELAVELGLDPALAGAHVEMHAELDAARQRHRDDARYLVDGYVTIPVVGTRQSTFQSAAWDGHALTVSGAAPSNVDPVLADGDGTVPRVSAIPPSQSRPVDFRGYFVAEQHASLQNQFFVLGDLVDRLKQLQAANIKALQGGLATALPKPLSVEVDDLYGSGEPVILAARPADAVEGTAPGVVAKVEPAAGGAAVEVGLEPGADGWSRASVGGLAPGLYRVEVAAGGRDFARFLPVHTLFEVAGDGQAMNRGRS